MKQVLLLFLAVLISACDRGPESPVQEPAGAAGTPVQETPRPPVQNAPQTSPVPIQPLTSAPAMPHTLPIPALVTGTGTPAVSAAPSESGSAASPGKPSPSVTGS
jgi:hypothetical protein